MDCFLKITPPHTYGARSAGTPPTNAHLNRVKLPKLQLHSFNGELTKCQNRHLLSSPQGTEQALDSVNFHIHSIQSLAVTPKSYSSSSVSGAGQQATIWPATTNQSQGVWIWLETQVTAPGCWGGSVCQGEDRCHPSLPTSQDEVKLITLRFTRVVFGVSSSPFLLNATLNTT